MKEKYIDLVENLLLKKSDHVECIKKVNKLLKEEKDKSKYNCIKRLCRSYYDYCQKGVGLNDFLSNLRHVILTLKSKFLIDKSFIKIIEDKLLDFGLEVYNLESNFEINASTTLPSWIKDTSDFYKVYSYEKNSSEDIIYGDSKLYSMTGYSNYTCNCQKLIMRAVMNQENGTTILGCMPTGAGKSLLAQMPAFYDKLGTTIVVVPTVALAMDQALSSSKYFKSKQFKPEAYYSGINTDKRKQIFNLILNGKLPMLYISPEALLNSEFNEIILKAAKRDLIKRLVIDEAHIVVDWGEFFRTEFQFLAVFRRKLLKVTNNNLKTILLSATLSERSTDILRCLFSEDNNFIEIRGDELRGEIIYYTVKNINENTRIERLLEILPYIPRPFIIYVPTIEYADKIFKNILEKGFYYVKRFTSRTSAEDREQILKAWKSDDIDIIIATSAFGMGVDKKDVRAVLHCYVPENIDRFYQEVGRGGRDGYKCISLSMTCSKEDNEIITYLTRSKVLSVDKIISRWKDIKDNFIERNSGNEIWVDTDITPEYLKEKEKITGGLSAAWNEYVLLFLYRQQLIDIIEVKQDKKTGRHILLIKILNNILDDYDKLQEYLNPIRDKERESVNQDIIKINSLFNEEKRCWANKFVDVYYNAGKRCSGCPSCRKNNVEEYSLELELEVVNGKKQLTESLRNCSNNLIDISEYMYSFADTSFINCVNKDIMNKIIDKYTDCIILPEYTKEQWQYIIEMLPNIEKYYTVFSYDDFLDIDNELNIMGSIVLIYDINEKLNDKIYMRLKKLQDKGRIKRAIHIANTETYIKSQNKKLIDCIEGFVKVL